MNEAQPLTDNCGITSADAAGSNGALAQIRIVLVDPAQPRNVGAAARALKSMGLRRLHLVRPREYPHVQAEVLAVSAIDVLASARVHPTLEDAIDGCTAVYAVSARQRPIPLPIWQPREGCARALEDAQQGQVALVFGSEQAGLSSVDLERCGQILTIPSDPACRSLNLAQAVQLICWELRMAALKPREPTRQPAPRQAFSNLIDALGKELADAGFFANKNAAQTLSRLRRILQRAEPNRAEIALLHGAFKRLGQRPDRSGEP